MSQTRLWNEEAGDFGAALAGAQEILARVASGMAALLEGETYNVLYQGEKFSRSQIMTRSASPWMSGY